MTIVGCYIRVSTVSQAEKGYSIEEQTERLQKYCDAMGWKIYKVYTDGGYTGANIDRPALSQLIKDIKKLDKVIVYKLDRLSRSQKDTLYLIEEVFLANECDFVSMSENFDTSTPFGKAMIGVLSVFAQLEREQIKERMAMGRIARAKKGLYHGSDKLPVGYDYIDGQLVVNEFEKIQVQEIFRLYNKGVAPYSIAQIMNDKGYHTKYGKWCRETVRRLLHKKTYIGYIKHAGVWYKGTHEPIIDEELFDSVQALLLKKEVKKDYGSPTSYLGGLVHCACCGEKYRKYTAYTPKKDYLYYRCSSRIRKNGKACHNTTWKMEELDKVIFDELKKLNLEELQSVELEDHTEAINDEIERIDERISRLLEVYSIGDVPIELLNKQIKELNTQKEALASYEPPVNPISHISSISDVIKEGDIDEVRQLINILIDDIVVNDKDIEIYWAF